MHGDGQPFTLLIDIKSDGESTYRALHELLSKYDDVFTHVKQNQTQLRAVTAIVSGNRPFDAIESEPNRFVGVDGRLSDLDSDQPDHFMPLISDNWGKHFQWRGKGEMSAPDQKKLKSCIERAHAKNRRIRFWGMPDRQSVWAAMNEAGVDMINTDDLVGLAKFLRSNNLETEKTE